MCIAGDDVWHLDCDKVRAEQGIHTGSYNNAKINIPDTLDKYSDASVCLLYTVTIVLTEKENHVTTTFHSLVFAFI